MSFRGMHRSTFAMACLVGIRKQIVGDDAIRPAAFLASTYNFSHSSGFDKSAQSLWTTFPGDFGSDISEGRLSSLMSDRTKPALFYRSWRVNSVPIPPPANDWGSAPRPNIGVGFPEPGRPAVLQTDRDPGRPNYLTSFDHPDDDMVNSAGESIRACRGIPTGNKKRDV
jgi:hypothetical protein